MSDNRLLTETTIRRFMKLANVDNMTNSFLNEMGKTYKNDDGEDEDPEPDVQTEQEEEELALDMGDMGGEGEEMPEEDPVPEDLGADMAAEEEPAAADMSLTEEEAQLLIDLGARLEEAMGGAMDAEGEEDMDMGAVEEPADAAEDVPAEPEAGEEEEPEVAPLQEALVNEVLKRVTKRLVEAKLKNRK